MARCNRGLLFVSLWLLIASAHAAPETFDLATFESPAGHREASAEAILFRDGPGVCEMVIYKSQTSTGMMAEDFREDWQRLVASQNRVSNALFYGTHEKPDNWKLSIGTAQIQDPQGRAYLAILSTWTGHGKRISALVRTNNPACTPKYEAFIHSIRLSPKPTGGRPALTSQEWYRSIANYSNWGFKPTGIEIAKISSQGYASWSYRFGANNTYVFVSEFWSLSRASKDYWFVEESGSYRQSGDTIQLIPKQVRRVLRDQHGRQQGAAQALPPEATTYRYTFQYLSGMERWYLILMPVNGKDTRRDGTLDTFPEYGKAYRYGTRPRCDQRPKPRDCIG